MKETMKSAVLWTVVLFMVVGNANAQGWTCGTPPFTYACGPNGDSFYVKTEVAGFVSVSSGGFSTLFYEDGAGDIYPSPRRNTSQCYGITHHDTSTVVFLFQDQCAAYGTTNETARQDVAGTVSTGRCLQSIDTNSYADDFYVQEFDPKGQSYVGYTMYANGYMSNNVYGWWSQLEVYCNAAYPIVYMNGLTEGCRQIVSGTFPQGPPLSLPC